MQENNLHDQVPSAYRRDLSTGTALTKVHSNILCTVERGSVDVLGMLDLTAAFETIAHGLLVSRLSQRFGVADAALECSDIKLFAQDISNHPQRM